MRSPRSKAPLLALLGLACGAGIFGAASLGSADRAAPTPAREIVAPRRAVADYSAHEWGVWRIQRGQVTHLADLRRESPPFVQQISGGGAAVQPGPGWGGGGAVARKPVIFFYADRPLDLQVAVEFEGGEPWLAYPTPVSSAAAGTRPGGRGQLLFAGRLEPAFDARRLAGVAPGHFWSDLRGVGATPFVSRSSAAERFLFYDGPVRFPAVVEVLAGGTFRPRDAAVGPGFLLWTVENGQVHEQRLGPNQRVTSRGRYPVAQLEERLGASLARAGLTGAEARSLLSVWRQELLAGPRHAIYLLPRAIYDRLLPIQMVPAPRELVRVGLVIERL